jgi:hypothetical protein
MNVPQQVVFRLQQPTVAPVDTALPAIENREHIRKLGRTRRKPETSKTNSNSVRTVAAAAVNAGITFGTAAHVFV